MYREIDTDFEPALMTIRSATPADAAQIAVIYNHYVLHTQITFEEVAVSVAEMSARIVDVQQSLPWLVHESDGRIDGYCYATRWRTRPAYRFAVETTVYLQPGSAGRGRGGLLYTELLQQLRQLRLHAAIGGIALPNAASIALHERHGFVKVAQFPEVGRKFERWIDVGYWQLTMHEENATSRDPR